MITRHPTRYQVQLAHPEFVLPGQQLVIPELSEAGDEWPAAGRTSSRSSASPVSLLGNPHAGWQIRPKGPCEFLPSAPVIRYDRVYVGLGDGIYYCLDRGSGRAKWRLPAEGTAGPWPMAAPLVCDGLAYLATPGGVVHAVDAYKGNRIWKVDLGGPVSAPPGQHDGLLYVARRDGSVHALETKTGAKAWQAQVGAGIEIAPTLGDGQLYILDNSGRLHAIDTKSGVSRWSLAAPRPEHTGAPETDSKAPAANASLPPVAPDGLPAEMDPRAPATDAAVAPVPALVKHPVFAELVVLSGGTAVDPGTGEILWQVREEVAPAARGEDLYFPGGVVDIYSGRYRWRWADEANWVPDPAHPLVATSDLLVGFRSQQLQSWRSDDGVPVWSFPLEYAAVHPPALAEGLVAIALADGSLRTVRMKLERQRQSSRGL